MSYVEQAVCDKCGATRKSVPVGYAEAVKGREADFPILARAVIATQATHSPKIEWVHGGANYFNYAQIIRTPFGASNGELASNLYGRFSMDEMEEKALTTHLGTVEQLLVYGIPDETVPRKMCGGVRFYLGGRMPRDDDRVILRPLRDLTFLPNRQAPDVDGVMHEWLGEFSLQVIPG